MAKRPGSDPRLRTRRLEDLLGVAEVVEGLAESILLPGVIDELIVVAGSFNYTEPANEYNDENIFVLGSTHAEVAGVEVEANPCRQLATHMKQEIERIISLSDPYDPST